MNCGVIYIATGEKCLKECLQSARSLSEQSPSLPITLYSDQESDTDLFDEEYIIKEPSYDFGDSLIRPSMLDYDRNLVIDSDTYICQPIEEIFDLLDRFDLAVAHNSTRNYDWQIRKTDQQGNAPASFCLLNTGVVLIKDNTKSRQFLEHWRSLYLENKDLDTKNQPAFREALYDSDLNFYVLPPEYNCRLPRPGYVQGSVKILHGRHPMIEAVAHRINKSTEHRVHTQKRWPIEVKMIGKGLHYRLLHHLHTHGLWGGLRNIGIRLQQSIDEEGYRTTLNKFKRKIIRSFRY